MSSDLDTLIHRYLEGLLSEEEAAELNRRALEDPLFRLRLAQISFDQVHLLEILKSEPAHAAVPAAVVVPPRQRAAGRWLVLAASVACFAIIGLLLLNPAGGPRVVAGRLRVDGSESTTLKKNKKLTVLGATSAHLRLDDGTVAELAPGSEAVLRDDGLTLLFGTAHVRVAKRLRVATALGVVTGGPQAAFTAELRMPSGKAHRLFVAVMSGEVALDGAVVAPGDSRLVIRDSSEPPPSTTYDSVLGKTSLTLEYAIELAMKREPAGLAVKAAIEVDGFFSIELAVGARVVDVKLDVRDGSYVKTEEDPDDESRLREAGMIGLIPAVKRALEEVTGRAVLAELKLEDGKPFIDVTIVANTVVKVVRLEGRTGRLVGVQVRE